MHTSFDFELQRPVSPDRSGLVYKLGVFCLLILWTVAAVASAVLAVAVFVPGHLGLANFVQDLANLLPANAPLFTT